MPDLEQRFRDWKRIGITEGRWRVTEDLGSGQLTLTIQPPNNVIETDEIVRWLDGDEFVKVETQE